jgi:hypothetical protein
MIMSVTKVGLLSLGAGLLLATAATSNAQVAVSIGTAPACPYGYYDYAPYSCAPSGYYGPEWFSGGAFVGAGPWFHGPENFRGHVDNHYDVQKGYKGPVPERGEKAVDHGKAEFHGNEMRDGKGHSYEK